MITRTVVILAMCACQKPALADEPRTSVPETCLGGPTSVPAPLAELIDDDEGSLLDRLATEHNLAMSIDYATMYQAVDDVLYDQRIVAVTAHDLNGSQTGLDCFPEGLELYKQAYVGWSASRALRFNQAFVITLWHAEALDAG